LPSIRNDVLNEEPEPVYEV